MGPLRIDLGVQDVVPLFISPNSQRLFARSWRRGTLKICHLQAAQVPEVIEDRQQQIRDVALLVRERSDEPEGGDAKQDVAVLLADGLIKLIDLTTCESVDADFLRVGKGADRLACSTDGKRMAIGYAGLTLPGSTSSSNAQVAVLDLRTRRPVQELKGGTALE
jgi:hypothetical protein